LNRVHVGRLIGHPATAGLAAAVVLALVARALGPILPALLSEVAVAIILGVVVGNLLPVANRVRPGTKIAVGPVLKVGIVLLGARLALDEVLTDGLAVLAFVALCVGAALAVGTSLAQRQARPRLGLLIAAGTAICGNSAIVAVAPLVAADDRDVAFAVATITGFGMLAVVLYPTVGDLIGMTSEAFGLWAGTAINDTSQVVAAGYAFDSVAGDTAVVTKLTRNLLIAPALIALSLVVSGGVPDGPRQLVRRSVPLFVIGFLLMATARSVGLLDFAIAGRSASDFASDGAAAAILVALAGIGLQTDVRALVAVGTRPLALAAVLSLGLATASLGLIITLGLGTR